MQTAALVQHWINTGDAKPICLQLQKIQEMMAVGVIESSNNLWAAPAVLLKEKDDSWHFCADFWHLILVSQKDFDVLPWLDDMLNQIDVVKLLRPPKWVLAGQTGPRYSTQDYIHH